MRRLTSCAAASSCQPSARRLKVPAGKLRETAQRRRSAPVQTAPVQIKILREAANPWYEVTLVEGRNRQIRRMFEEIGHHVEKIKRVRYGPLQLDVEPGKFRFLTAKEVGQMKSAAGARVVAAAQKSRSLHSD